MPSEGFPGGCFSFSFQYLKTDPHCHPIMKYWSWCLSWRTFVPQKVNTGLSLIPVAAALIFTLDRFIQTDILCRNLCSVSETFAWCSLPLFSRLLLYLNRVSPPCSFFLNQRFSFSISSIKHALSSQLFTSVKNMETRACGWFWYFWKFFQSS